MILFLFFHSLSFLPCSSANVYVFLHIEYNHINNMGNNFLVKEL